VVAVWQFEHDAAARYGREALGSGSAPHLTVRAIPAGVDQARDADGHVAGCVNGGAGGRRRHGGAARHERDDAHRYASVPFSSGTRGGMDVGELGIVRRKCDVRVASVHDLRV